MLRRWRRAFAEPVMIARWRPRLWRRLRRIDAEEIDVVVTDLGARRFGRPGLCSPKPVTNCPTPKSSSSPATARQDGRQGDATGRRHYLTKPLDIDELRAVVDKAAQTPTADAPTSNCAGNSTSASASRASSATAGDAQVLSRLSRRAPGAPCSSPARTAPARNSSPRRSTTTARTNKPFVAVELRRPRAKASWKASSSATSRAFTGAERCARATSRRQRRHAVSRRGRRHAVDAAGQAAARARESGEIVRVGSNEPIRSTSA